MFISIIALLLILSIAIPYLAYFLRGKKGAKAAIVINIFSFFAVLLVSSVMMFTGSAFAEPVAEAVNASVGAPDGNGGMLYIAAALVTGLSTVGAGIAVASAASAALGAISENEKIMGKALIFVALAEGIALYGLLVSFFMLMKV